ncbi:MAG: radical SAM protein [Oscillospiraceae bacterium]|nr:radical SAM protein [Oscillospiraceae bacterium]
MFCNQHRIAASVSASLDDVRSATAIAAAECGTTEIAFYGGSFTALPVHVQNEFLTAAQPFNIRISTRPDCIDESVVERLKSFGVATIELGAQSMCDDVLESSRRGHTASDVFKASKIIQDAGLSLILQMMTGLPGDTHEKSLCTAEQFIAIAPDGVRIYPTVVVRGTALFDMWQCGDYQAHTVENAVNLCATLCAMFDTANIPIIRLGLNPTEALSAGEAVAGAYHPAFGELVYSRLYLNQAIEKLAGTPPDADVILYVPKNRVSVMTGQHRTNHDILKQKFALRSIKVIGTDLLLGEEIKVEIHA